VATDTSAGKSQTYSPNPVTIPAAAIDISFAPSPEDPGGGGRRPGVAGPPGGWPGGSGQHSRRAWFRYASPGSGKSGQGGCYARRAQPWRTLPWARPTSGAADSGAAVGHIGHLATAPGDQQTQFYPEPEQHRIRHIGKYVVNRFIGHGAMGRVYLGQHPELQLQVAVKVIDDRYAADARYRRQFLQEARWRRRSTIRTSFASTMSIRMAIAASWCRSTSTAATLPRSSARRPPAACPARRPAHRHGVAAGLAAAEKLQIVHRDVSPATFCSPRRSAQLADLGLARKTRRTDDPPGSDGTLIQPGSTVGTPAYMAPEQILDAGQIDIRADIYAWVPPCTRW